jgi:hypothetical protein
MTLSGVMVVSRYSPALMSKSETTGGHMKRQRQQEVKRFTVVEQTWMGTPVYNVWDTLMDRSVLSTMDYGYAFAECNRLN